VRYYLDGTVLQRLLGPQPDAGALRDWLITNRAEITTSILARWEVAEQMALLDHTARVQATDLLGSIRDLPITGKALEMGSFAVAALNPYGALHVGIVAAHGSVNTMVTFDPAVASAARVHGLEVFAPGLPANWYVT
jgi:hypothetical protein